MLAAADQLPAGMRIPACSNGQRQRIARPLPSSRGVVLSMLVQRARYDGAWSALDDDLFVAGIVAVDICEKSDTNTHVTSGSALQFHRTNGIGRIGRDLQTLLSP